MNEKLRRFKRDLAAGRKTPEDWKLWCTICAEPQYTAIGTSGTSTPLPVCISCFEEWDRAGYLSRRQRRTPAWPRSEL